MLKSFQGMRVMELSQINFYGQPQNYSVIDKYLSRSAQPQIEDLAWLKEQGVTDVFNFRTMLAPGIDFDEKYEVEKLGMKYHNIPSVSANPSTASVDRFLSEIKIVLSNNGKAHLHCKAGADRTGMYSLIYKSLNNISSWKYNTLEMIKKGHDFIKYPKLIPWIKQYLIEKSLINK